MAEFLNSSGGIFKEQILKRKFGSRQKLILLASVCASLALLVVTRFIPIVRDFVVLAAAAEAFAIYLVYARLNVEYEYIVADGYLDIDIIYNKSKRKHCHSFKISDFESLVHLSGGVGADVFSGCKSSLDYSSGSADGDLYAFVGVINGVKTKIVIEPGDMMLKAVLAALPARKFIK